MYSQLYEGFYFAINDLSKSIWLGISVEEGTSKGKNINSRFLWIRLSAFIQNWPSNYIFKETLRGMMVCIWAGPIGVTINHRLNEVKIAPMSTTWWNFQKNGAGKWTITVDLSDLSFANLTRKEIFRRMPIKSRFTNIWETQWIVKRVGRHTMAHGIVSSL